ncbi:MAG: hypothetical protein FWG02_09165 [Holophagaceae bacterium]|nr:hypothetical protein [Holophagaceae bacterium]
MRLLFFLLLVLPLSAQAWDIRFEAPLFSGKNLPTTLVSGTGQLTTGKLDSTKGGILSVNHRMIRLSPLFRLEWGAEINQWDSSGFVRQDSITLNSSFKQVGGGVGLNAQLWIPFTGLCAEIAVIQRLQQYKYSTDNFDSHKSTESTTWLRFGLRWRLPFVPILHPYVAASYQQPVSDHQPVRVNSIDNLADYFIDGSGKDTQKLWTFGVGITF